MALSLADVGVTLLAFLWLPCALSIGVCRRLLTGGERKSFLFDVALIIVRWSTALPLSLKRLSVKALKTQQALESPRFREAKHELCQYLERTDFAGYWVHRGALNEQAQSPAGCDLVLLWIHGGAYVLGDPLMSAVQILRIAEIVTDNGLSSATFSLKYGLAPEHTFPQPFEQGVAAYRYLLEELKIPAERIVICGESAGGHLGLTIMHKVHEQKLPKPGYALLQYPWVDLTNSGKSVTRNKHNDMLVVADLTRALRLACKGASSSFEDVLDYSSRRPEGYWRSVLPRTWVGVGSHDLFVDSVQDFVSHAQADGCEVTLDVWKLGPHGWPGMQDALPRKKYLRLQPGEDASACTPGAESIAKALLKMVQS